MTKNPPELLPARFGGALLLGGLAGGCLTPFWFAVADASMVGLAIFPIVAAFATVVWLVGLAVIGLPSWLVLHRLGYRNAWAAAGLGAVLLLPAFLIASPDLSSFLDVASFVLMGPVVGWVIWRVAYRGAGS